MKAVVKYAATLLAFILAAFGLSWFAVYGFWFAPRLFQSVPALRACEVAGTVILIPVRILFWLVRDIFDQSIPLSNPLAYAAVNGVLLGVIGYASCRRWMFATRPRAESATQTQSRPRE